jgi:hypothetical protein
MPTTTPKNARDKSSVLEKQATASIDAITEKIQTAVRHELKDLRNTISARLDATIERALSRDRDGSFDAVVKKLCDVADEQAVAASSWARSEAEEAAARELQKARAEWDAVQQRNEQARLALEERLAKSEAANADLERSRSEIVRARGDAERAAAAARQAADSSATALKEARRRIEALEQERTTLVLARDIAEAQLEGEIHHRNKIAAELHAAREKAGDDAEAMELHAAGALDRVRSALQRLTKATTGQDVVEGALELLAEQFSRAALFAVGRQGLTVWGSHGFDPPLPNRKAVPPGVGNSPLMRAALDALTRAEIDVKPATVLAGKDKTPLGLTGEPISYAIAMPIVGKEQSALILYAENTARTSAAEAALAGKTAEIIGDHLAHRLRKVRRQSQDRDRRRAEQARGSIRARRAGPDAACHPARRLSAAADPERSRQPVVRSARGLGTRRTGAGSRRGRVPRRRSIQGNRRVRFRSLLPSVRHRRADHQTLERFQDPCSP